jgi:hypothetical protein
MGWVHFLGSNIPRSNCAESKFVWSNTLLWGAFVQGLIIPVAPKTKTKKTMLLLCEVLYQSHTKNPSYLLNNFDDLMISE